MVEKEGIDQRKEKGLVEVTEGDVVNNSEDIIASGAPIWRKKKDGTFVTIPLDKWSQYIGIASGISLYMEEEWAGRIKSSMNISPSGKTTPPAEGPVKPVDTLISSDVSPHGKGGPDHVFHRELNRFSAMTVSEREDILDENIERIRRQGLKEKKLDIDAFTEIVDVMAKTFYINKVSLDQNSGTQDDRDALHGVLSKTDRVIASMIELVENEDVGYRDFSSIDRISTGSTTVDHMNKVLLRFIPFCQFYNDYFSRGLIKKIRVNFKKKYELFYRRLMPDVQSLTLEIVFRDGMRRITEEEFHMYSIATLLHDLGKLPDINYHDGSEGYNPKYVIQHAPVSYNMIIKAKLPWSVAAIAALHHEYYGDPSGYHVSKALFKHFENRPKQDSKMYIISYNADDIKNGLVWAYFPCKMLEIIDVFDALTDKNRKYRNQEHSVENALSIMKDEFIIKKLKIDPILFDIFLEFVGEYAVLKDPSVITKLLG